MFVWFVVTLHVREMLTFCTHCRCAKRNPRYTLLNLNSSSSAFFCVCVCETLPWFGSSNHFAVAVQMSSFPIYIWSDMKRHLFDLGFIMFVLSNQTAMHAFFCLLYGVFEIFINKIILSERYVCMSYKREPQAHAGMFFFFLCVGECVCMPNKKLHIFKAF